MLSRVDRLKARVDEALPPATPHVHILCISHPRLYHHDSVRVCVGFGFWVSGWGWYLKACFELACVDVELQKVSVEVVLVEGGRAGERESGRE